VALGRIQTIFMRKGDEESAFFVSFLGTQSKRAAKNTQKGIKVREIWYFRLFLSNVICKVRI
jgi:hypothetical protein